MRIDSRRDGATCHDDGRPYGRLAITTMAGFVFLEVWCFQLCQIAAIALVLNECVPGGAGRIILMLELSFNLKLE